MNMELITSAASDALVNVVLAIIALAGAYGVYYSQTNMNHMDDGIFENREAVILHEAQIADAQKEIKVLKDATLNNMTNNVFLINFDSVNSVAITSGIYDPVARKLYV